MKVGIPATGEEMKELNKELENIEYIDLAASVKKSVLKTMPKLTEFIEHCCLARHYFFLHEKVWPRILPYLQASSPSTRSVWYFTHVTRSSTRRGWALFTF